MKYMFVVEVWDAYLYWQQTDKQKLKKINELLKDFAGTPFERFGKPEPLKHKHARCWPKGIDGENHLIYRYMDDEIQVAKCRHHFD